MTQPTPGRMVDYFLVVGFGDTLTPIADDADGSVGPDGAPRSYLDRLYAGDVMARFPATDHASVPFPVGIQMFCIPDSIRLSTSVSDLPHLYYFAATQGNGHRLYGACLQFWEALPPALVAQLEENDRRAYERGSISLLTAPGAHSSDGSNEHTTAHNPLSRAGRPGDAHGAYEHEPSVSVSTYEVEHSVTHKKLHSRSPSMTPTIAGVAGATAGVGVMPALSISASPPPASASAASPPGRGSRIGLPLNVHAPLSTAQPALPSPSSAQGSSASMAALAAGSTPGTRVSHASSTVTTQQTSMAATRASSASASVAAASGGAAVAAVPSPSPRSHLQSPMRPGGKSGALRTVYAPKCLCLLSLHPFLEQYRVFLTELYRASLTPSPLPLERLISNFFEVPLPPMGVLQYQYTIANRSVLFACNPPNNPLKYVHSLDKNRPSRILTLFELLDVENILFVVECLLQEKRILFLSSKLSLLTMVSEIFLHLLYPFPWPHVYIPLLPRALIDFLNAPMPLVVGMHSSYVRGHMQSDMLVDLVVVDLDKNKVHYNNNPHGLPPSPSGGAVGAGAAYQGHVHHFLPSKERKKLKEKLKPFQALFSRAGVSSSSSSSSSATASAGGHHHHHHHGASHAAARPPHLAYQLRLLDELDLAFPNAPHPDETDSIAEYSMLVQDLAAQEDAISLAFFRTFVSLFKDYREFLIWPTPQNPMPDPCFRLGPFLKKSGHATDASASAFFTAFVGTQAFQKFCEERLYAAPMATAGVALSPPVSPGGTTAASSAAALAAAASRAYVTPAQASQYSVQFFDESIIAKRNRSKFAKRVPTPFLDDTRFDVRATVPVPPPESCGLPPPVEVPAATSPSGASTNAPPGSAPPKPRLRPHMFCYDTFPTKFEDRWFWGERIKKPPPATVATKRGGGGGACAAAAPVAPVRVEGLVTPAGSVASSPAAGAGTGTGGGAASPLAAASSLPGEEQRPELRRMKSLARPCASPIVSLMPVHSPYATPAHPGASAAAALAALASSPPRVIVESLWFLLASSVAAEWKSLPLLMAALAALKKRVYEVVRERARAQQNGRLWNAGNSSATASATLSPPGAGVTSPLSPPPGSSPGSSVVASSRPCLVPPPEDSFLRVMRSCGACSAPDKAIDAFHAMISLDEYAALEDNAQMYAFLLNVFAMTTDRRGFDALAKLKKGARAQTMKPQAPSNAATPAAAAAGVGAGSVAASPGGAPVAAGAGAPSSRRTPSALVLSPLSLTPQSSFLALPSTPGGGRGGAGVGTGAGPDGVGSPGFDSLDEPLSARRLARAQRRRNSRSVDMTGHIGGASLASFAGRSVPGAGRHLLDVDLDSPAAVGAGPGRTPRAGGSARSGAQSLPPVADHVEVFAASFPGVSVRVLDRCGRCDRALTESDLHAGWAAQAARWGAPNHDPSAVGSGAAGSAVSPEPEPERAIDCPSCGQQILVRLMVVTQASAPTPASAPASADAPSASAPAPAPSSSLTFDFLSPLSLRHEALLWLEEHDLVALMSPSFRAEEPALFWNMAWHFCTQGLPLEFLAAPAKITAPPPTPTPSRRRQQAATMRAATASSSSTAATAAALAAAAPVKTIPANVSTMVTITPPNAAPAAAATVAAAPAPASATVAAAPAVVAAPAAAPAVAVPAAAAPAPILAPVPAASAAASPVPEATAVPVSAPASDRARSASVSLSSATTASADDIAAELGESFTSALPNSPNTETILATTATTDDDPTAQQLDTRQAAAPEALTELVSPSSSVSDASVGAPIFHSPMSGDETEPFSAGAVASPRNN